MLHPPDSGSFCWQIYGSNEEKIWKNIVICNYSNSMNYIELLDPIIAPFFLHFCQNKNWKIEFCWICYGLYQVWFFISFTLLDKITVSNLGYSGILTKLLLLHFFTQSVFQHPSSARRFFFTVTVLELIQWVFTSSKRALHSWVEISQSPKMKLSENCWNVLRCAALGTSSN